MTPFQRVTYSIRVAAAHLLYYCGVLHLLSRLRLRRKAVVLMYHRVLTSEERHRSASQPGLIVEDQTFARQVAWLKRHFTVLTLDQFADRLRSRRPFEDACCLITFDDGWIDNFTNALPVLRAEALPAVIFLPSSFIGTRRLFPRERFTHLLAKAVTAARSGQQHRASLQRLIEPLGFGSVLDIASDDCLSEVRRVVDSHRFVSGPEIDSAITTLSSALGVREEELSDLDTFIDWEQVETMARQGVTFGGHGVEHHVLTRVPVEVATTEVAQSKSILDFRLRSPVHAFAYPGGGWNAAIASMVQRSGYQLAFTVDGGFVSCDDNPLALRRVNIHEEMTNSMPMFMARIVGLF